MTTVHDKQRQKTAEAENKISVLAAERFRDIVTDYAGSISTGVTPISIEVMGKTDPVFVLEILNSVFKEKALSSLTPEKKKLFRRQYSKAMFLNTLNEHGGVLSSAEAAKEIGKSKVTVKTRKDNNKLLALNLDGEFFYPVFQFVNEKENAKEDTNSGVLKGMEELLPLLNGFSDRMKYSFFMKKRNIILDGIKPKGREFTVAELLKENPNQVVMNELKRLARLEGSQDPA